MIKTYYNLKATDEKGSILGVFNLTAPDKALQYMHHYWVNAREAVRCTVEVTKITELRIFGHTLAKIVRKYDIEKD